MLSLTEERILELLFDNLTKQRSIHEISKLLKTPYAQAYRNVKSLIKKELVVFERSAKAVFVGLNNAQTKKEYISTELSRRDKALKKYINLKLVFEGLERIPKFQYICIVFGSFAKGTPRKDSDVDLLFIIPKDYDYGKFEIMARNAFVVGKVDVNIALDESLHEMWSNPQKLNVGNELLKGHIILKGVESFLEAWRKHNAG